jgi:cysteine-rich repeat protein
LDSQGCIHTARGVVDADEQCDDGNNAPGDGCDALCRSECVRSDWQEAQVSHARRGKKTYRRTPKGKSGS